MSGRRSVVEWVETTEEVVASEESTTPDTGTASAVLAVLEHSETPIQKLLDTMVQAQDPEVEDEFYCSECRVLFQVDQGELGGIDGPSFVLDSPTAVGVTQRALLTLPHGLMIGRSSIPTAGLGVINQGPTVSPGMHFGPYEGEATTREGAIQSDFSWEVFKGKGEYEYIDAARETHSNWMRYVNCARSEDENNLLAVQYKDSILFHCCRAIHPGDELMVWPSSKLFSQFSNTWTQIWFLKCTPSGSNATLASQVFTCAHCQLSFTTEAYLQRHTDRFHLAPTEVCATPGMEAVEGEGLPSTTEEETPSAPLLVLTIDPVSSKTCSDCGKIFKHSHHLRRHKLNVHSNKRPYCCPQCRRCFSQTSGLLRHQLMHKKQALEKGTKTLMMLPSIAVEQNAIVMDATDESVSELPELSSRPHEEGETLPEGVHESPKPLQDKADVISVSHEQDNDLNTNLLESSDEPTNKCLLCEKTYRNEIHLKKHQLAVHKNLRPYVCSLCRKSFYQYSDLARHLKLHQKLGGICDVGKTAVDALDSFSCSRCLLSFSSEDSLEQHVCEQDPEENPQGVSVSDQEKCPLPSDDEEKLNPNFIAPPPLTKMVPHLSQRPQRLGARSKLSAITKMIAPKRRQKKTPLSSPAQEVCTETEVPDSHGSMHTDVESAKFSCRCCKGTYSSEVDLKAHKCTMTRHGCAQCKASFKSAGFLKRHEKKAHSGTKTYTCDRCDKTFAKLGNFKQHQKSNKCLKHHCSSELFPCPFCQFSFTMKSYLYKHIKRHHPIEYASYSESHQQTGGHGEEEGGEPHVCPRCGKKYVSEKIFKSHACFKQVRILYLCTDCGKGFTNHYGLKQHQRIHTGEKPYSCPHCGKSFSYMGQVNVHIRTHTGEKPYLCTHCGESFRQSGDLKRHERKHTGVRPHNCPDCFRSFSRPQSLKAHQMLHLGQKMFKCTQCGKSFSRNYHLRRHHQKMHS